MKRLGFEDERQKRKERLIFKFLDAMKKPQSGFSVLELVIVMAIILIVAGMAVTALPRVMDSYRMKASGRDVAAMLLQTRMAAVHANQPYYAQITSGLLASAQSASQLAGGAAPTSDPNPTVATTGLVAFQGAGLPDHTQLDNFVGGTPPTAQINGVIGFTARGTPCVQGASSFICSSSTIGFEWFMQSSVSKQWEAVTVTPAGRVKSWRQTSAVGWQ